MSSRLRCWLTEAIRRDRYIGNGIRILLYSLWIYNAYGLGGPSPLPPASYTFVHNEKPVSSVLASALLFGRLLVFRQKRIQGSRYLAPLGRWRGMGGRLTRCQVTSLTPPRCNGHQIPSPGLGPDGVAIRRARELAKIICVASHSEGAGAWCVRLVQLAGHQSRLSVEPQSLARQSGSRWAASLAPL